jgi:PTS system ascorbate-specific IIA component
MINVSEFIINENTFALRQSPATWQEAVRIGVDKLAEAGAVEQDHYYRAILDNVAKNGPYFVLLPGFAMPHARPEAGVIRTSMSLVTLATPVEFGNEDNDPVDVVLTIAAEDPKSMNEEVIVQVMNLIDCDEAMEALRKAENAEDLAAAFAMVPEDDD